MSVSSQKPIVVSVPPVTVTHRNLSCFEVLFTLHHFQGTVLLDHLLDPIKCANKEAYTNLSFNVVIAVYPCHPFHLWICVILSI